MRFRFLRAAGLHLAATRQRLARDQRGVSGIEFALLAPVLLIILAGTIDFGLMLHVRFTVNQAVSSSANYAIVNGAEVTAASGATLAASLAAIMPSADAATIIINHGPQVSRIAGGANTASGTAANAGYCYCPTTAASGVTWGSATTCGAACTGGGTAGKFVSISASRNYVPIFVSYGFVEEGTISVSALVQVQ